MKDRTYSSIEGTITPPASKSEALRALLLATVSEGTSRIKGLTMCEDVQALLSNAPDLFDSPTVLGDGTYVIKGGPWRPVRRVNCGSSAFLLRTMPFLLAAQGIATTLCGSEQLASRSHVELLSTLERANIKYSHGLSVLPLSIEPGESFPVEIDLNCIDTSQPVSGLFMAFPLLEHDVIVRQTPLASIRYIVLTLKVMEAFGIKRSRDAYEGWYSLPLGVKYEGTDYEMDGDWSALAYWYAAIAKGGHLAVRGLKYLSDQPDFDVRLIAEKCGITSKWYKDELHISHYPTAPLLPFTFDAMSNPDLVPPLVALAIMCNGQSHFTSLQRLRNKESNRQVKLLELLKLIGVRYEYSEELDVDNEGALRTKLYILGGRKLPIPDQPLDFDPAGDHRMAMMACVISLLTDIPIRVKNKECVAKSYPAFFKDLQAIAPDFTVL